MPKYTLTLEFENQEELLAYLGGEAKETTAPKKKTTSKKKPSAKKAEPESPEVVEPEIVQEAPIKESPGQAAFNRDAALKLVSEGIAQLQQMGKADDDIGGMISGIFSGLGIKPCRIGDLDDSNLINFKIAFDRELAAAMQPPAQEAIQGGSFI